MNKVIIPMGEECYTAGCIDSNIGGNNFRKCAFPFDYVWRASIENIYDNLFDLLNSDSNCCTIDDFVTVYEGESAYYRHKKYGFDYIHDTSKSTDFSEEETNNFIEKYNRRYTRLIDYLKNSDNVTILSVNLFHYIHSKQLNRQLQVHKLFDLLQLHNKKIKFIAVNYGEELYNTPNLEFVNLPVNYRRPDCDNLELNESRLEFIDTLIDFTKTIF